MFVAEAFGFHPSCDMWGNVEPKGLRYNDSLMRQLQVINVRRQVDS